MAGGPSWPTPKPSWLPRPPRRHRFSVQEILHWKSDLRFFSAKVQGLSCIPDEPAAKYAISGDFSRGCLTSASRCSALRTLFSRFAVTGSFQKTVAFGAMSRGTCIKFVSKIAICLLDFFLSAVILLLVLFLFARLLDLVNLLEMVPYDL